MAQIITFPSRPVSNPEPLVQGIDDIESAKLYDFRGEWARAVPKLAAQGYDLDSILSHDLTLAEIGQGVAIAVYLKRDMEAAYCLLGVLKDSIEGRFDTRNLNHVYAIDPSYVGYVWTLDYQILINAASYVRHRFHDLVDYKLTRAVFFPNSQQ